MLGIEYIGIAFAIVILSDIVSPPKQPGESGTIVYEDQDDITE